MANLPTAPTQAGVAASSGISGGTSSGTSISNTAISNLPPGTATGTSSTSAIMATAAGASSTSSTQNAAAPTPSAVNFDSSPIIGESIYGNDRVILTYTKPSKQVLWWYSNSSTTSLDNFKWYVGREENDYPNQAFTGGSYSSLVGSKAVQDALPTATGFPSPGQGSVGGIVIDLEQFLKDDKGSLKKLMNIHVNWTINGQQGYSISGAFSIVDNPEDQKTTGKMISGNDQENNKLRATQGLGEAPNNDTPINSSHMPGATGDSATSGANNNPGVSSPGSNSDSDHDGGGGLSTGAKAGIGVACGVVGLALFAALIFLLMRRRRNNNLTPVYKDEQSTTAFVGDKELHSTTHAVNDGVPARHIFRDDTHQQQQQVPLNGAARTMDASHSSSDDAADPYYPYHDLPPRGAGMSSQAPRSMHDVSSLGVPETPSAVPHNVAHLVEDGMTEEDIRRLEREERELDEDLERAGRR